MTSTKNTSKGKTSRTVPALLLSLILIFSSCSSSASKARAELAGRGIAFSQETFLDQVKRNDLETVKLFLVAGMSPDAAADGYTALLEAARRGHEDVALELIAASADIDAADPYDVTALMFSLITGSGGAATALMEKGADVNARDVDGRTALIEALTTENDIAPEIIQALIDKGAGVNVGIAEGITPLMIAVFYDPAVVRMLVAAGADVNARDANGASVLRMARDDPETVRILKEAGAVER